MRPILFLTLLSVAVPCLAHDPKGLSDEELSALTESVRIACELPPAEDTRFYPWYFHYEMGVALGEKQDWNRAVSSFNVALDKRPDPSEHGRTYGMWFLAYRPYFHLGMAQYRLGRYECASKALKLSKELGEIAGDARLVAERGKLIERVEAQMEPAK